MREDPACTCSTEDEAHSCPFAEEIHDDDDPEYCTCCEHCTFECAMDI